MSMDENAMFKALLKNQPQQKTQAPVAKEVKETVPAAQPVKQPASVSKNSEDAMFKALLKNRPQQQSIPPVQKTPVRTDAAQGAMQHTTQHTPAQAVKTYEEPVVETAATPTIAQVQSDEIVESVKNLIESVNMIYGLLKSVVVPVLALILVVGIAILIKS